MKLWIVRIDLDVNGQQKQRIRYSEVLWAYFCDNCFRSDRELYNEIHKSLELIPWNKMPKLNCYNFIGSHWIFNLSMTQIFE